MTTPVVIAGGGLAGAAAACVLARAGCPVTIIERQSQATDKICGEFLSAEAQHYLSGIGIDLFALGAHKITSVRLVNGRSSVACKLPFAGAGLSRRVLDEALLHHAAGSGAAIRRGHTITLRRDRHPIILDLGDGEEIEPQTLFLATGKHDLRGLRRMSRTPSNLVGFKLHLALNAAQTASLAGHVEIIMLPDGYAGLQLVENGLANLCLLVTSTRLQNSGNSWDGLLEDLLQAEPHLRTRLTGAAAPASRPLSIFRVPYGFVHAPSAADPPGIFRLGDQMGVIPSFTGDGMSIALHSAILAATCHLAGDSAAAYHRRLRRDIAGQIARAGALHRVSASAPGRSMLIQAAKLWPAGLRLAAQLTRVPAQALLPVT